MWCLLFCYNNSKKATTASLRGQGLVITAAFKFLYAYEKEQSKRYGAITLCLLI